MRAITTDVLVIGGGGAGTYAALRLQQLGIPCLLVSKGPVGKSGASIMAGALIVGGKSLGGTQENADASLEFFAKYYQHFLVDQDYLARAGDWIERTFYPELDELGLYFRRDDQGTMILSKSPVRWSAAPQQGQTGILLMEMRRRQLIRNKIDFLDNAMVTSLLVSDDGQVCGATILSCVDGEFITVHAKAVVLATGHADRLTKRVTATREQSADGIALALRAGAELTNLEMQFWHTSDFKYPKTWQRMHIYPNPLLGTDQSSRMYNAAGDAYFQQSRDAPSALAPYSLQIKRLIEQVRQGKADLENGYSTSYSHIDPSIIKAYQYHAKAFAKLGYDVSTDKIETCITMHYRQGGIETDSNTMKTSVAGLYVAGGVGGHVTGSLAVATFDGNVVAESLARSGVLAASMKDARAGSIQDEKARLEGLLRKAKPGDPTPMAIKKQLWELMWKHMGPIKTSQGMLEALDQIASLRELLPTMGLPSLTRRLNSCWIDAIDVQNMLDVCEVTTQSALARTESRGSFFRSDFPYTDNTNWLTKNVVRRGTNGDVVFRREAYGPQHLKPGFEKQDYFSVPW